MNKFFSVIVGLFVMSTQAYIIKNSISSTDSLTPIMQTCQLADKQTLVIFDIDDVLVTMIDAVFQTDERYNPFMHQLNDCEQKDWIYQIWEHCSLALVDEHILQLLKYLKQQSIKTLALTAGHAGPKAHFKAFEHIRYERLKSMGIEFDWSFAHQPTVPFYRLALEPNNPPLFDKGILYTCGVAKSRVLEEFLKHLNYKPTNIVFIDDLMLNINDIGQWCAVQGINYKGFHYTAADQHRAEFNEQRACYQAAHLIRHGLWLSDKEADKMLSEL